MNEEPKEPTEEELEKLENNPNDNEVVDETI